MDMQELRQEICRVGRSLFERGYVHATAGNISVRLDEAQGGGFLITPTDACLGFLQPEALAWVDDAGTQRGGERASKALALHQRIYAADAAARCILHTHSTHLVALSLQGVWQPQAVLPPITPYYVMKVGKVPHIPYHRPGDPQAAQAVEQAMEQAASRQAPIRGVLLERLGPTVWHTSLAAAMAVLEELEETARLWLTVQPRPEPLSDAQIDELRQQFGATW
ncbi:Ribulose-5-phosphate 4-epimerase/Fuculose-1-phosphate aldolase [Oryzisolibacter propanilivorax]|uniref:Ribulose-5-phosphate 4-epimerase/Fuculose-1-phosphate aldolase n=1 Tax=Oryzisolibacter propanilivorax TaxID=1527607 RepID=A0A1G9QB12_9BURK|nr:aldolase [Oryzisolibacter propanilivorax]SDM08262.1 Ribulose-5-phosphate 4-epimerase/Fuculose-1-phosphate aldolase [Oryzisolibacter propanilivorax]